MLFSCASDKPKSQSQGQDVGREWISLFNGENLDGWIVKIAGREAGDNYGNTFRVEGGVLKVAYDEYDSFDRQFGSLFTKEKFSNYRLRAECRFVGEQAPGGPEWGFHDSGIQLHSQPPGTMLKEQEFPISVEINLVGRAGELGRMTGNVCTPGTHIVMNGELFTGHCATTSSVSVEGDQWVTIEAEVRGSSSIKHFVNGEIVAEYSQPQLDESSTDAQNLISAGWSRAVSEGHISIQSNSHPIEFRKIEIQPIDF